MIDFTRAFGTAWERTNVILFRPFDFGKWCAIGFSAFLAGLIAGGNGVNGSFNVPNTNGTDFKTTINQSGTAQMPKIDWHDVTTKVSSWFTGTQLALIILIAVVVVIIMLAVAVLVYWLGSRGQFMFLDNLVRNRGEISWPWSHYARQANSALLLYLVMFILSLVVFIPILIGIVVVCIPLLTQVRWPVGGEIVTLVVLGTVYVLLAIVLNFIFFIFREFGFPIMFRRGIMARQAFVESMRLLMRFPGSIAVFILLRIAIFFGVVILCVIICCLTCCIGTLPYIGTVLLLPVLVYVRCFTLDCLSQFGPEFDVWTVDVPPVLQGQTIPPLSPPRPPV